MNNSGQDVKSAVRVLEILELLARAESPMTLKTIVEELGYPKSSAFNLLATLVARAYVVREDADTYRIHDAFRNGPGWLNGQEAHLIAIAQPIMNSLLDTSGETVFLGKRRQDGRIVMLAKSVSFHSIRFDSELTGSDPAYCTASGRVMLAFWDPDKSAAYLARERIVALTEHTEINRVRIHNILDEVRKRGYAICDEEAVIGGSGAAAPVYNPKGEVIAVLNVAAASARFPVSKDKLIQLVVAHAAELSNRLGFRPTKIATQTELN